MNISVIVYILCAVMSVACAVILWRAFASKGMRLLFWSSLCFIGLAINNAMLFVDLVIIPTTISLAIPRALIGLASVGVLLYGLIMESS